MPIIEILLLFVFGSIVGFIGGYAGISGAPFLIFFLVSFLNYSQHTAQGTVIAVMMGPMTLFGVIALKDFLKPYIKYLVICIISYAIFSYVGGMIAYLLDPNRLKILFGFMLLIISIFSIIRNLIQLKKISKKFQKNKKPILPLNIITISIIGITTGIIGGIFGICGGILLIPAFTLLMGLNKDTARAISLAILLPPVSIGAVIKYQNMGDIRWEATLIMFLSFFILNYFGSILAKKHLPQIFAIVFAIILLLIGIITIILSI